MLKINTNRLRFLSVIIFALILVPSAKAYYDTSGTYRVITNKIKVYDHPDSRSKVVGHLTANETIKTMAIPSAMEVYGSLAFFTKLFAPESRWMVIELSDGQIAYLEKDSRQLHKIGDKGAGLAEKHMKSLSEKRKFYIQQSKTHLKWVGFALIGAIVLCVIGGAIDNLIGGLLMIGGFASFFGMLIYYFANNPYSFWFVTPTIGGWGLTLLCILPTLIIVFLLVGELVGSFIGIFSNPVNIIEFALMAALSYFLFRGVYLEVMDLAVPLLLALTGAGVRPTGDYGTLTNMATGEYITGVRFSGNKAYSGNRTFTNNGSGYFE